MVAIAVAARLALPGYGPELLRHLLTVLRLLTFLCLLTGALGGKLLLTLRLGCIAPIAIDRAAQGGRKRMQPTRYPLRSEEHTSELQSLMRISSAVFCLKKKKYSHTCAQRPRSTNMNMTHHYKIKIST